MKKGQPTAAPFLVKKIIIVLVIRKMFYICQFGKIK